MTLIVFFPFFAFMASGTDWQGRRCSKRREFKFCLLSSVDLRLLEFSELEAI
jgi:hypothetical protein